MIEGHNSFINYHYYHSLKHKFNTGKFDFVDRGTSHFGFESIKT